MARCKSNKTPLKKHKYYTKEEEIYITEKWGQIKVETIAKNLNRDIDSIYSKAWRLGLGKSFDDGCFRSKDLVEILKVEFKKIAKWVKEDGLKCKKIGQYYQFEHNDVINFLKNNQDKWNSTKLKPYGLGIEPQWLKDKRKKDNKGDMLYSKDEEEYIKIMWSKYLMKVMTKEQLLDEVAKKLNRTKLAINTKIVRMKLTGVTKKIPFSHREESMILDMFKKGYTSVVISEEVGRHVSVIRAKKAEFRNKGLLPKIKKEA